MKAEEGFVENQNSQLMLYVEHSDGSYGAMKTGSFMVQNYFDDFIAKQKHYRQSAFEKLARNQISPVHCFMLLLKMTPADLASRVGISPAKVKKHMTPKGFKTITLNLAWKYADVFGIPVANLFQILADSSNNEQWIQQQKTDNPFVIFSSRGVHE